MYMDTVNNSKTWHELISEDYKKHVSPGVLMLYIDSQKSD